LNANVGDRSRNVPRVASEANSFWRPLVRRPPLAQRVGRFFPAAALRFIDSNYVTDEPSSSPTHSIRRHGCFAKPNPKCVLASVHLGPRDDAARETPPALLPDRGLSRYILPAIWSRSDRLNLLSRPIICFLDRVIGPGINRRASPALEGCRDNGGCSMMVASRRLNSSPRCIPGRVCTEIAATHALPREGVAPLRARFSTRRLGSLGMGFDGMRIHRSRSKCSDQNNHPMIDLCSSRPFGPSRRAEIDQRIADIASRPRRVSVVWCCPSNPGGLGPSQFRNGRLHVRWVNWFATLPSQSVHHGAIWNDVVRAVSTRMSPQNDSPDVVRPIRQRGPRASVFWSRAFLAAETIATRTGHRPTAHDESHHPTTTRPRHSTTKRVTAPCLSPFFSCRHDDRSSTHLLRNL